ncbi:ABC transporter related protein [Arthrospira platensis C1]|nr:ABC transporter related protein [Arthrospira platensis C1]
MKQSSSYWQLLPYVRPQSRTIAKALTCTLVFTAFWPLLAWLMGQIAGYIGRGDVEAIAQIAGGCCHYISNSGNCPIRSGYPDG